MSLWQQQQDGPQPRTTNPAHEQAMVITDAHAAAVEKIRANRTLSHEGRQVAMAPVYARAKSQLGDLQAQTEADQAARVVTLHRQAFGVPADPIAAMSYRDAQGRAAAIDDPNMADHLMQRALLTGDELMAKALAQHAADRGWPAVLNRYLDVHPEAAAALTELANTGGLRSFVDVAHYFLPKPIELAAMQDHQIAALAAQQQGT